VNDKRRGMAWTEHPKLYEVAKEVCFEQGIPWTDPRTGVTHFPPTMKPAPPPDTTREGTGA